jgi:hypothetical protein
VQRNGYQERQAIAVKTHDWIIEFKKINQLARDTTLEAVEWIGNQCSHESDLTAGDVLAGLSDLSTPFGCSMTRVTPLSHAA